MNTLTAAALAAAAAIAAAGLATAGSSAPAEAQSLGQGDFALCSVYRPDGGFAGYDSACLERQRAAIRRFSDDGKPHYATPPRAPHRPRPPRGYGYGSYSAPVYAPAAYPCPGWANQGYGYSTTSSGFGGHVQYGTFTSSVNGQPCIPSPNIFRRGLP